MPQAQAVGVLQKVAEQLHERALFHRHQTVLRQLQFDLHLLVAVDLVQRTAQAVQQRLQRDAMAYQTALAEAGALQLVADLLAHAFDLRVHHLGLLAALRLPAEAFAEALQHAERGFQAVRQVAEGVAVLLALAPLAVEQAVQRAGQAQQLARVLLAEVFAAAGFHFVELGADPPERAKAPGQAEPEQCQQHQQAAAEPQVELAAKFLVEAAVFAGRLHGDEAECRIAVAGQMQLDVVDEVFQAFGVAHAEELGDPALVARAVVDAFVGRRARMPEQFTALVEDEAEQLRVRQVEFLVRQPFGHFQSAAFQLCRADQGAGIGRQALLDDLLEGQAECALQRWQQRQHEQHRQAGGAEHQAQAQRHGTAEAGLQPAPAHRQRSVNR